ncbi:hypothetical protein Landi51_03972 [Colletotrichum acutatum]
MSRPVEDCRDIRKKVRSECDLDQAYELVIESEHPCQEEPRVDAQRHRDPGEAEAKDGDREDATRSVRVNVDVYHAAT